MAAGQSPVGPLSRPETARQDHSTTFNVTTQTGLPSWRVTGVAASIKAAAVQSGLRQTAAVQHAQHMLKSMPSTNCNVCCCHHKLQHRGSQLGTSRFSKRASWTQAQAAVLTVKQVHSTCCDTLRTCQKSKLAFNPAAGLQPIAILHLEVLIIPCRTIAR